MRPTTKSNAIYILCASMFFVVLAKFFLGKSLFLLATQPLYAQGLDSTLWLFQITGISKTITHIPLIAFCLDALLLILFLLLIFIQKRIFVISTLIIYLMHSFTYQIYSAHFHKLDIVIALCLIVLIFEGKTRQLLWEGLRYYLLFVMASSALYKIANGAALDSYHLANVLTLQHADIGYLRPDFFIPKIAQFLIQSPMIAYGLFISTILLQGVFSIGFFSKKYDKQLFFLLLVFVISDYIIMRFITLDLIILGLPLLIDLHSSKRK
jgi:hypothetical protein